MEQSTLIKYAALAVAAYVVYRYVQTLDWFSAPAVADGPSPVPASTSSAAPAEPAPAPTLDEQYRRAASDEDYARTAPLSLAVNVDQWNWYRAIVTGQSQPDPLLMGFTAETRAFPITARQYWDALKGATGQGVAGLSGWRMPAGRVM